MNKNFLGRRYRNSYPSRCNEEPQIPKENDSRENNLGNYSLSK
jgi:hypothetical protein